MFRKLLRFFLIPLQVALICFLIATGAFLWRLHQGPININKLTPYLINIASHSDTPTNISIKSFDLQWGGFRHLIDFAITDFKAFNDKKQLIASIPKLTFSFSPAGLLQGTIAPRTLEIYRPYLDLSLNQKGEIQQNVQKGDSTMALDTLFHVLKREKHLVEFSLINAGIKVTDTLHNAAWNIPEVNLTYSRRLHKNKLNGSVKVSLDNNRFQTLQLKGNWKRSDKKIPLTVSIDNIDLIHSVAAQKYPFLKNFTTPVSLKIQTQLDILPLKNASLAYWRKAVDEIKFTLTGGKGIVNLPDPVIARYDLQKFTVKGSIHSSADKFDLTYIDLIMQNGATAQGNMTVSGIGRIIDTGNWENIRVKLNANAQNVPMAMLPSYWPASLGPHVHDWVKRNLRGGMINNTDFILHFKGEANETGITPDMIDGTIDVTGTQVVYLDDMPSVDNVSGQVHLTLDDLVVTIHEAESNGVLAQKGGTFSILGMTKPVTTAALDVNLNGSVPDVLEIIDAPALRFMSEIGIDPAKTTGIAQGNLKLDFPIGDAFESADQIYVKVDADIRNADVDDIIFGMGLQDAILKFKMDGKELSLNGTALFYGATAKYSLAQSFEKTKETMTDIKLHVDLNDRARHHLNYPFFTDPAVSGVMPTDLSLILKNDDTGVLNISSDLTNTIIDLREIGWIKHAKTPGTAHFVLELKNGKPTVAPVISADDALGNSLKGSIRFTENGQLSQISVPDIKTARTDAHLTVDFSEDKSISVVLNGTQLDMSGLLKQGSSLNIVKNTADDTAEKAPSPLSLKADIDKVWLSEKGYSEQNTILANYHDAWENIRFNSFIGQKKVPLSFSMLPTEKKNIYTLSMMSEDAGYTLKALDYISSVKGGKLELSGKYTAGTGAEGNLLLSDFYLENDQTLIQVLQLTSLTGIIDSLRGEGLFFEKGDVPFVTDKNSLTINSAVVSGSSLGITLNGKYYRQTGYMNLYGSIIPFYSVNSFLGKIPLIGRLFSGEKGGGLIAPTYTIKGKLPSPDISVNGFSALAPGAIRSIFGKIAREEGDLSKEDPEDKKDVQTTVSEKQEKYEPIDPASQIEIKDEKLQHEKISGRILEP